MASLTGLQIKDTYNSLLKTDDNSTLTSTFKNITDGIGNSSALYLNNNSVLVSGSLILTGSITVITGSNIEFQVTNAGVNIGSTSNDVHIVTGSLLINGGVTATNFTGSFSGSFTGSISGNAISASFASTASSVNILNQTVVISGYLTVTTGSGAELQVTNTGVTFGNSILDRHTVTGSLNVSGSTITTGSLSVSGSVTAASFTGSFTMPAAGFSWTNGSPSYANLTNTSDNYIPFNTQIFNNNTNVFELVNSGSQVGTLGNQGARIHFKQPGVYEIISQVHLYDLFNNIDVLVKVSTASTSGSAMTPITLLHDYKSVETTADQLMNGTVLLNVTSSGFYTICVNPSANSPFPSDTDGTPTRIFVKKIA